MATILRDSVAGFVLAGGHSSRMGSDKALALFGGVPLVTRALQTLLEAGIRARIAGSRSELSTFAEVIPDTFSKSGPMGGVHAGLVASKAEWNLFLPVDVPLMPGSLLACLTLRASLTGALVIACRLNGRIEPFPVVLHHSVLPQIAMRLDSGESSCQKAWHSIPEELGTQLEAVSVENLVQCGQCCHPAGSPAVFWFQSANTPTELANLHRISMKQGVSACAPDNGTSQTLTDAGFSSNLKA